jgi:hypothetical protein
MQTQIKKTFTLGQLVSTPGAIELLRECNQTPFEFIARHAKCDWSECNPEDAKLNERAVEENLGDRIMSVYKTSNGEKLWIVTEIIDEDGNFGTTLLLPSEY